MSTAGSTSSQGPSSLGSGVTIWYQIEGRYPVELENFTRKSVSGLQNAIMKRSKLEDAEDKLCLFVAKPGKEKEDLNNIENELGDSFDFNQLIESYNIKRVNPIIVRLLAPPPLADKLTETQLLALVPPSITYIAPKTKTKTKTTTKSTWARTPIPVKKWNDFILNANEMAVDTTPRYDRPTFMHFKASEEQYVRVALQINVFEVLSTTIGARRPLKEEFNCASAVEGIKGNPDFVLLAGGSLLLPIEVKTRWILPDDNMVERYNASNPPECVIDSIRQIFGYMAHNERQYGVLSTYDKTWFLWRPKDGLKDGPSPLFVSDVVKNEATSPTLLRCFAYIMMLAHQDPHCPPPPKSPPRSHGDDYEPPEERDNEDKDSTYQPPPKGSSGRGWRDSGRGGASSKNGSNNNTSRRNQSNTRGNREAAGNRELRLEKFDWDSFETTGVLGDGRSGTVFEATFRGERVALKLCDLWQHPEYHEEMLTEVRTYLALEKLQGYAIPKLKSAGYTAGGLFALMMELAGSPIEVENLSDKEREEIVRVLADIHGYGFLHGDIRPDNILIRHYHDGLTSKIMFIDFAFSKKISNQKEPKKEIASLKNMLRPHSVKKPRIV